MWNGPRRGSGSGGSRGNTWRTAPYGGWGRWTNESEQDWNANGAQAAAVVAAAEAQGPLVLLRNCGNIAGTPELWEAFVEEPSRRSFSYVLRRESGVLHSEELAEWFEVLHPRAAGVGPGAWTDAAYRGRKLLRKTAWYVWPPCCCAYDYADTHQEVVSEPRMREAIEAITRRVAEACGVQDDPPNSVNLNFYPPGGGVGFHSDDEPLFDGLNRDTAIISLSLAEASGEGALGSRWFEVRHKRGLGGGGDVKAVELRHGDIMTMEGLFQLHYLHSAWPGDRSDLLEGPGRSAFGERVNLTWRWIVRHGRGCPVGGSNGKDGERGGGAADGSNICWSFLNGRCRWGEQCRWSHDASGVAPSS